MKRLKDFRYYMSRGLSLWDSLNYSELLDLVLIIAALIAALVAIHWFLLFTALGRALLIWVWGG